MEGGSLVNMGNGVLRLQFIDAPGSDPIVQAYMDSVDGGLTFGAVENSVGLTDIPHMTVRSYLSPSVAGAITHRRTDAENDGRYDSRYTPKPIEQIVHAPSAGVTPTTTDFTFDRTDLGLDVFPDYYRAVLDIGVFWQGPRSHYRFVSGGQIYLDGFINANTAEVFNVNPENLLNASVAIGPGAGDPLVISVENAILGYATNEPILITIALVSAYPS
jgi:hypothetical protein